jgi:hypothetical protein
MNENLDLEMVRVYGNKYVTNLGGSDPEDRWSRDSTETSWDVCGAGKGVPSGYREFNSMGTRLRGKLYAVYAIWSTGDSFGSDSCAEFEIVWIYDNEKQALAVIDLIKEHAAWYRKKNALYSTKPVEQKFPNEYMVNIPLPNGETMDMHTPWNGYFERLEDVACVSFEL